LPASGGDRGGPEHTPQKHVWRAPIILLTTEGCGTEEICQDTIWRWQERFMTEGVAGLLRDKTRHSAS
jgi:hypothetical protein